MVMGWELLGYSDLIEYNNNFSKHVYSAYVPDTVLSVLMMLTHLIP